MSAALAVLTPSTMNYDAVGRGGSPELTRAEMSGMLTGLSPVAMNYALAKYCDDADAFRMLQIQCIQVAVGYAVKGDWKVNKGKPCIISLGVLSAIESVNPLLCFACNSVGMAGEKVCSCAKRRKGISHADRYRYVDLCQNSWVNLWRDRYEMLFGYCESLDSQVRFALDVNRKDGRVIS